MISWFIVLVIVFLIVTFFLFRLYFRRDPERIIPKGNVIVAPADGKIIAILDVDGEIKRKKGIGNVNAFCNDVADKCVLIAIFMSPLSVHINRAPLSGEVLKVNHTPGKFLPSQHLENGLVNEKTETLIRTVIGNIKVIQISGILVRRISNWLNIKQKVKTGEKIGIVHFGSQVWIIAPRKKNIKITVKIGDKVYAGSSIIARY